MRVFTFTRIWAVLAGLVCVAAGVYLILLQPAVEESLIGAIAHGLGVYFVGKGIFAGATLWVLADQRDLAKAQLRTRMLAGLEADASEVRSNTSE